MRQIITYPNKLLMMKSEPVREITQTEIAELHEMHQILSIGNDGIGLAAPQVGILKRMVVIHLKDSDPMFMINPKIIARTSDRIKFNEGCLSFPGVYADVIRSYGVEFQYTDMNGQQITNTAKDLLAVCVQHEIDHLDGKLFIDRLSKKDRSTTLKEYYAGKNDE